MSASMAKPSLGDGADSHNIGFGMNNVPACLCPSPLSQVDRRAFAHTALFSVCLKPDIVYLTQIRSHVPIERQFCHFASTTMRLACATRARAALTRRGARPVG